MNVFQGLCVSKGNVCGRAVIIKNTQCVECDIPKDSILVVVSLERELLINMNENVIGVVAEFGNIGSHGAGILRQLGIPCVLRIKNATEMIKDGDAIEISGDNSYVMCNKSFLPNSYKNGDDSYGALYKSIAKKEFNAHNIEVIREWSCPRPERSYQRMRFDIIREVYGTGAHFLFDLPTGEVTQNEFGAITIYGHPRILDICSFVLANPEWLIDKAKERCVEITNIKNTLVTLLDLTKSDKVEDALTVFTTAINLYRRLFKYALMSQAISDEILELYVDFISFLRKKRDVTDIMNLKSDYVEKCLDSKIDPGVSQRWNPTKSTPHIWDGSICFDEIAEDMDLVDEVRKYQNGEQLLKDYNSFRIIVPLVYQLSEEFFYVSSSINTFINWGLATLCRQLNNSTKIGLSIQDAYEYPLDKFINEIKKHIEK